MQVRRRAQHGEMLDRLMGRPILAEPDRVVGEHINHAHAHQGREPDRAAGVVGEDEERAAIGDEAAMQRDPVHRRRHAELADAVADVAAGEIVGRRATSCPW